MAGPAHGDILLMTPLLRSMRRAMPDATIDVLIYDGQSGILRGNPDVDTVISASKHPGFRESLRLLRRILRRYDLSLSNKQTDRAITYALLAGRKRVAVVPADRQPWKQRAMTASVPYDHEDTHTLLQNNAMGALLGIEACYDIRLPTSADAASIVDALLPPEFATTPFAVLHINPGLPHKRWTDDGWSAVAAELQRRRLPIVLTGDGSEAEQTYLQSVTARMPPPVLNLGGKLRFADVTELLSRSAVFIGTDTVATHMASTTGVPTIALFGPESSRVWGPWPKGYQACESPFRGGGDQQVGNVYLLQSDLPCPTCRQGHCLRRSERRRNCTLMQTLDSGKVVAALEKIFGGADLPSVEPGL